MLYVIEAIELSWVYKKALYFEVRTGKQHFFSSWRVFSPLPREKPQCNNDHQGFLREISYAYPKTWGNVWLRYCNCKSSPMAKQFNLQNFRSIHPLYLGGMDSWLISQQKCLWANISTFSLIN